MIRGLQFLAQVVGVHHGQFGVAAQPGGTQTQDIRVGADHHAEVPVERRHAADAARPVLVQMEPLALARHTRSGQERFQLGARRHGT